MIQIKVFLEKSGKAERERVASGRAERMTP
jgi:hypothetical protein